MPVSKELIGLDERFSDCKFLVEATSCEQHYIWCEFHNVMQWEEDCMGFAYKICELDKRPVMICFTFCKINGHRICFYYGSSQVVDHKAIEDFLFKNFNVKYDKTRWAHCDAMNFGHCLSCVLNKNTRQKLSGAVTRKDKSAMSQTQGWFEVIRGRKTITKKKPTKV